MPSIHMITTRGLGLTTLLCACSAGTGGQLVDVQLALAAKGQDGHSPGEFETQTGFQVSLEEATLAVRSILIYAPKEKALSLAELLMGRALAHGGYDPFNGRIVRMEYSEPLEIDLLATQTTRLGAVLAETGPMGSATVIYADQVHGHPGQGFVRGRATRDGEEIAFEGTLRLENEPLLRRVDGIRTRGELVADGTVTLVVHPQVLLDEAHFERLDPTAKGTREITQATQVHTAWVFGARSTQTFSTKWETP